MEAHDHLLRETILAFRDLMKRFSLERVLYMICAIIAAIILVAVLVLYAFTNKVSWPQVTVTLGASGLIALSAGRVNLYLHRAGAIIATVISLLR